MTPTPRRARSTTADAATFDLAELDASLPDPTPPDVSSKPDPTPSGVRRRLSFRARWALTVTAAFACAGAALIGVEYLLVANFVPQQPGAHVVTIAQPEDEASPDPTASTPDTSAAVPTAAAKSSAEPSAQPEVETLAQRVDAAQRMVSDLEGQVATLDLEVAAAQQQLAQATSPGSQPSPDPTNPPASAATSSEPTTIEESTTIELTEAVHPTLATGDASALQAVLEQKSAELAAASARLDSARAELGEARLAHDQALTSNVIAANGDMVTLTAEEGGTFTYTVVVNGSGTGSIDVSPGADTLAGDPDAPATPAVVPVDAAVATGLLNLQRDVISDQLATSLIGWSAALVVAFAALAGLLAWWLAGRGTRRIGEVTALARDISTQDLSRRLDLPGPHDEIKELGDTFDSMLGRLQRSFDGQRQFVANASHELRTPLTTTRTALEIPLEQGMVPPELTPAFETALAANARSENVLASLLALARSSGGPVARETVPLADLARESVAELEDWAGDAVTWHTNLADVAARGDAMWLGQAIANLARNAVAYNRPDGEVWVTTAADGDRALVEIANTGPELSEAEVARLTEPFYRGEATRLAVGGAGVGLGLSIVAAIAEACDADLDLAPREGGGLVSRLRVPAAADRPTPLAADSAV